MKLSKAQVKALEAVEAAEKQSGREMYKTYREIRSSTRSNLVNMGLVQIVSLGLLLHGLVTTETGREALEEARNGN